MKAEQLHFNYQLIVFKTNTTETYKVAIKQLVSFYLSANVLDCFSFRPFSHINFDERFVVSTFKDVDEDDFESFSYTVTNMNRIAKELNYKYIIVLNKFKADFVYLCCRLDIPPTNVLTFDTLF